MNQTIKQSQAIPRGLRFHTPLRTTGALQRTTRDEPERIVNYTFLPLGGISIQPARRKTEKAFTRMFLRWTIGISALLVAFAYYGAGH